MSRSSTSSNRRSSESEDHTSSTSYTSADVGYKGKGKARATEWDAEGAVGPSARTRAHPLSAPSPWDAPGPSTSRRYPLSSTQRSRIDGLKNAVGATLQGKGSTRRIVHFVLALSIPVLGLLLANEMRIATERTRLHSLGPLENRTNEWEAADLDIVPHSLVELRRGYTKKRRREIELERMYKGSSLPLLPAPDGPEWSTEDETELVAEARNHWPTWWGSKDLVGPSPYDHVAVPASSEKKRLLFLTSYHDHLNRMNTHTYEIVDAALRHPGIITDVWGPGWKGYQPDLPLSVNVQRRARRIEQLESAKTAYETEAHRRAERQEDAVERRERWAKWSLGLIQLAVPEEPEQEAYSDPDWQEVYTEGCGPVKWEAVWTISDIFKQHDKHLDALSCGALLVQQLGDCHEFRCFKEWYPQANNITLSKYAFELEEIFSYDRVKTAYPDWQMGIFGHNPDTGNEWDFYPVKWSDKVHDATMFGFDVYPIRTTITDRHHAHNRDDSVPEPLVKHHRHPGYSVSTDQSLKEDPMETYTPGHWSYENHRKLREDFAQGMRQARICVFDSSLERKLIRKYAQAFLSGCVVAGDFPTEHEEALSKFMIHIHPSWKIDRIEDELRKYLADPERLEQMALEGFIYARRYLTTTRKIDHVMSMAKDYREGVRGYEYPYSFSLRCRAYWSNERAYRPPWCAERSLRGLET